MSMNAQPDPPILPPYRWNRLILRRYFKVILANGRYTVLFCEARQWWLAS